MFDSYDTAAEVKQFSGLLFGIQLLVVPLSCLIFALLITVFFGRLLGMRTSGGIAEQVTGYLVFSVVGFTFGYVTQTAIPRVFFSGGRWIWIPPVSFLVWGIFIELKRNPSNTVAVVFDVGTSVAAVLCTLPAIASCLYSFGVVVANRPATTALGISLRDAALRSPMTRLARLF